VAKIVRSLRVHLQAPDQDLTITENMLNAPWDKMKEHLTGIVSLTSALNLDNKKEAGTKGKALLSKK
jgi:hypothetical protein